MLQTVYDTPAGRKYRGYVELKDTIKKVKVLSEHYTGKYAFFDSFSESTCTMPHDKDQLISMECTFIAIVILYGKCFSSADRRKVKLDENILSKANDKIKETHKTMISSRNAFVAHAGYTKLESFEFMICYDNGLFLQRSESNFKVISGQLVELENLGPLLDVILDGIEKIIEKVKESLEEEFKILTSKLPVIIEKMNTGQSVTKEDLK